MRLMNIALCLLALLGLLACNPTLNWREVRVTGTSLSALLPCKPDEVVRPVPMGATQVALHMQGCEAGKALFAVAYIDVPTRHPDAGNAAHLLGQWQVANMTALQAKTSASLPQRVAGAEALAPKKVTAIGLNAQGARVESQAVYFAQGLRLYYAVILAPRIDPEMGEAFFTGLKLQ